MALLFYPACSRQPAADLPPTLLWHKNQTLIHATDGAMNVWEGFRVRADHFEAEGDFSQFILWRCRAGEAEIQIEYLFQGKKGEFAVNVRQRQRLKPAAAFRKERFRFAFSRGMNFLQFSSKGKAKLLVRSITVGRQQHRAGSQLRQGEGFSLFLPPGRGRLELRGRGRIEVVEQRAEAGDFPEKTRQQRTGWLSRRIVLPLESASPATLTVTVRQGEFDLHACEYAEDAPSMREPSAIWEGTPNIYIVLSDACQASHLGAYGYQRNTSPHIDAFARDAVMYENAYTNAVFTRSSVASILTGLFPDSHKTRVLQAQLPRQLLTLPEYLKAKGYRAGIITSSFAISPHFGFTQGVDDYFHVPEKHWAPKDASIFSRFKDWLATAPPVHFCYMHYIHPHFPKVPPAEFPVTFRPGKPRTTLERLAHLLRLARQKKKTGIRPDAGELQEITDAYDSSIAWVDAEFGKLLALLKEKKLYDDSMIVFIADHGEAIFEHDALGHGSNVYEETSRVPLIVKYPRGMNRKGRARRLAELADIFPTIASLFGQKLAVDGRELPPPDAGLDGHVAVSRTINLCPAYGLRYREWYYIIDLQGNREQLFDLAADPLLEIGDRHPRIRAFFKARFLSWYGRFRNIKNYAVEKKLKDLPASELEEMKTLGYL